MCELFEYPDSPAAPNSAKRSLPQPQIHSHVVTVPSKRGGKDVEYARLSDSDHQYARDVIEVLDNNRRMLAGILSQPSGLYGLRSQRKQTKGDVLDGLMEKLRLPHPKVRGRKGEDFTLKQLRALNAIIDDVNAHLAGNDAIPSVHIPS